MKQREVKDQGQGHQHIDNYNILGDSSYDQEMPVQNVPELKNLLQATDSQAKTLVEEDLTPSLQKRRPSDKVQGGSPFSPYGIILPQAPPLHSGLEIYQASTNRDHALYNKA